MRQLLNLEWLILVNVRQKTTKFCKAIILQLKERKKERKEQFEETLTKKTESSVALAGPPWAAVGDLASGLMV